MPRSFEPGELKQIMFEHYAVTLERIAQDMQNLARRDHPYGIDEGHAFDLEAVDQFADRVRAVRVMIQMENRP